MASILVVDDVPDSQEPLARYLEKAGHQVRLAHNAVDALNAILDNKPDVVVLDLLMPGFDGPSVLEVARTYIRLQSLPVVVLTALEEGPLIERARKAKVSAILIKSKASLEQIRQAVETAAGG
jgi:CheY-like chemotaxis protein